MEGAAKASSYKGCTLANGGRNAFIIGFMYRHALRVSELCATTWDDVDLLERTYYTPRSKNGKRTLHILEDDEVIALTKLLATRTNEYVFNSQLGEPWSRKGIHKMVVLAGQAAKFNFRVHPHMLRHAKGYQLANEGVDIRLIQDYMGHRNIANTVIYTDVNAERFRGLGKDIQI